MIVEELIVGYTLDFVNRQFLYPGLCSRFLAFKMFIAYFVAAFSLFNLITSSNPTEKIS